MSAVPITFRSRDGKTVRVEFGPYTLSVAEAHAFAFDLSHAASQAENADSRHAERHVNLLADCPLCVYEAEHTGRVDALEYEA